MNIKPQFASILVAACVSVFLSLPAFARPANRPQDQGTVQTQSGPQDTKQQDKKQKAGTSPGKDVGKGGEDVGKGAAKGAGSLGKGTAGAAGNLATFPTCEAVPPSKPEFGVQTGRVEGRSIYLLFSDYIQS